jgi:8-oxo-dGTP diphosphatase
VKAPAVTVAVGGIVRRGDALLLVQRAREPGAGRWSVPGGRVEFGESLADAVVREVREETGIEVRVDRFAGWVERIDTTGGHHFVILDFFASETHPAGSLRPGDDAADARWVPLAAVADLDLVDGLSQFLASVGVVAVSRG